MSKAVAAVVHGGLTQTTKMPCKSYSLPTAACQTGARMAQIEGSICSVCYADKGNYRKYANNIEPAQHARLVSLEDPAWVSAMVASIGADSHFRWHDSGDLQSVDHLRLIALVCEATPNCAHWLPTREYSMVKDYVTQFGALPSNLVVRLSAMYPDKPVVIPLSLQGVAGIAASNVHQHSGPVGEPCMAPSQKGECRDCRACWQRSGTVSYSMH
jgi:hypothetical protein